MSAARREPCSACPYRVDVPAGVWAREEYDKLDPYDLPTPDLVARLTIDRLARKYPRLRSDG